MKKILQTQKMNVIKSLKPEEKIRINKQQILPLYHKLFYYYGFFLNFPSGIYLRLDILMAQDRVAVNIIKKTLTQIKI